MVEPVAFEYSFQVGMSSVDHAGVVFFPELFRHAHDAYEAFMDEIGEPLSAFFEPGQPAIPIVHAQADYHHPMRHGDRVHVQLHVTAIKNSSMTLGYDFVGPNGEVCAQAVTTHVFIDRDTGTSVPIPEPLRQHMETRVTERDARQS